MNKQYNHKQNICDGISLQDLEFVLVCLVACTTTYQAHVVQFIPVWLYAQAYMHSSMVLKTSLACDPLFGQLMGIQLCTLPAALALQSKTESDHLCKWTTFNLDKPNNRELYCLIHVEDMLYNL